MSDRPPNQIARIAAVGGLITMFLLVIVVIASSGGGGSDSGGGSGALTSTAGNQTSTDPHVEKALEKGAYRVKAGDTLTSISEATGVDLDTLIQLNPDTDPQALIEGRKIKLR
ncbi:MAG: LysM domain-containing protein [Solirubrobacterales bacterium]